MSDSPDVRRGQNPEAQSCWALLAFCEREVLFLRCFSSRALACAYFGDFMRKAFFDKNEDFGEKRDSLLDDFAERGSFSGTTEADNRLVEVELQECPLDGLLANEKDLIARIDECCEFAHFGQFYTNRY